MSPLRVLLLTRYVAGGTFWRAGAALLVLLVVFISIDIVETTARVRAPEGAVVFWYLLKLPSVAALLLPLALTLGASLEVASLKNSAEWDAMSASGISPRKSFSRLLAAPLVATLLAVPLYTHLGPGALSMFARRVDPENDEEEDPRDEWFLSGGKFVKQDGKRQQGTVIEGSRGWASARYDFSLGSHTDKALVWRQDGGFRYEPLREEIRSIPRPPAPEPAAAGMFLAGANLTAPKLAERIARLQSAGHPTAPYEAEQALRIALILACFLLPFGALLITLGTKEERATRLTGIAIAAAVLFWLLVATAWNGALLDIWPPWILSLGAPALFLFLVLATRVALGRAVLRR